MPTREETSYDPYQLQQPGWQSQQQQQTVGPASFGGGRQLNTGELNWMMEHMRKEDKTAIGLEARKCFNEISLTRGLPAGVLATIGCYYLPPRFMEKFRTGPKRWAFYGTVGLASFLVTSFFSAGKCNKIIQSRLIELYPKYQAEAEMPGSTILSYAKIREANRAARAGNAAGGQVQPPTESDGDSGPKTQPLLSRLDSFTVREPTIMSGTPSPQQVHELNDPYAGSAESGMNEAKMGDYGGVRFS